MVKATRDGSKYMSNLIKAGGSSLVLKESSKNGDEVVTITNEIVSEGIRIKLESEVSDECCEKIWRWADKNKISDKFIPRDKTSLVRLKGLRLKGLNFGDLPAELYDLPNIKNLSLGGIGLAFLDEKISKLEGLESIDISYNKLESLPNSICDLKNVDVLFLVGNDDLILSSEQEKWLSKLKEKGAYLLI